MDDKWEGGVSLFLVLSGFLMAYNYWHDEEKIVNLSSMSINESIKFSANKIRKLYPLHLLCLVPAIMLQVYNYIFVNGMQINEWVGDLLKKTVVSVTLTQAWVPNEELFYALNGVAFFLCICAFNYFVFPLLTRFVHKARANCKYHPCIFILIVAFIQIVVGFLILLILPEKLYWTVYICPIFRLGDFIIGCFLGMLFFTKRSLHSSTSATILEVLAILLTVASQVLSFSEIGYFKYGIIFIPSSILLIWVFAEKSGYITKFLTNKILVFLGSLTPFMYLVHQIIIRYLKGLDVFGWPNLVISLVLSIGSAFLWGKFKERKKPKIWIARQ